MPNFNLKNKYKLQAFREYNKKLEEKQSSVRVSVISEKRSIDQNSLYWMWLACIEKETGINKNELHLLYRANFIPKQDEYIRKILIPELWERIRMRVHNFEYFKGLEDIIDIISHSTTSLDKAEMVKYMDKIKDHAMINMGVLLLALEEKGFVDFANEYSG